MDTGSKRAPKAEEAGEGASKVNVKGDAKLDPITDEEDITKDSHIFQPKSEETPSTAEIDPSEEVSPLEKLRKVRAEKEALRLRKKQEADEAEEKAKEKANEEAEGYDFL